MGANRPDPYRLIFDGDCGFCRACVEWVEARDGRGRVRSTPFQEETILEETGVSRREAERAVLLVAPDGRRWSGAEAVARTLRLLPGWEPVGRLMSLPLLRSASRVGYRWVADHRGFVSRITGFGGDGDSGA